MDVFYTPPSLITGPTLVLEGEESVHCARVLRKKPGEEILVADGAGTAYAAVIEEVRPRTVHCRVTREMPGHGEPARRLHLAAALLKNTARYDVLVEKCTELGMSTLTPLLTERTIPRHARTERWRSIAMAAMKQSGRCRLPAIGEPAGIGELLKNAREPVRFMAHELAQGSAPAPQGAGGDVCVMIGPEGGFTAAELGAAQAAGFVPLRLGPRRLRAETAAIVAVTLLLAESGAAEG